MGEALFAYDLWMPCRVASRDRALARWSRGHRHLKLRHRLPCQRVDSWLDSGARFVALAGGA